jgi:hypothetical protein
MMGSNHLPEATDLQSAGATIAPNILRSDVEGHWNIGASRLHCNALTTRLPFRLAGLLTGCMRVWYSSNDQSEFSESNQDQTSN